MHKIQRVSLFFRVLFQIAFIVLPVALVLFWLNGPNPIVLSPVTEASSGVEITFIPKSIHIMHAVSGMEKFYGFLITLIPTGIDLLTLYFLIKLFRLYEKGEIFTISNVRYLRNIAYTLLVGELINPIYQGLISGAMTWHNPPGHRFASIGFDGTDFGIILLTLFIILISWIMAEGCKLREEQQLTI